MKSVHGVPNNFSSLAITAKAAKLRLFMTDNVASGGPHVLSLSRMTQQAGAELAFLARKAWLAGWRKNSIPLISQENKSQQEAARVDGQRILSDLIHRTRRRHLVGDADNLAREKLQRTIREKLLQQDG